MSKFKINELHRTVILLVLLGIGLIVIFWQEGNVQDNFVDSIETTQVSP